MSSEAVIQEMGKMPPDLEAFLTRYHADYRPTYYLYHTLLTPFFTYLENKNLDSLTYDDTDVVDFLNRFRTRGKKPGRKPSHSTKRQTLQAIRRFTEFKIESKALDKLDEQEQRGHERRLRRILKIRVKPTDEGIWGRKALSLKELDTLFYTIYKREKDFSLFYLYGYFGLRRGEIRKIVSGDETEKYIIVKTSKMEKKEQMFRTLYYDDLTSQIYLRAKEKGWLNVKGTTVYAICEKYKHAFPEDVNFSPHSFRHTFNSHMGNKLMDERLLHYLIGHTDASITATYDQSFKEEIIDAMTKKHYYNDIPSIQKIKENRELTSEIHPV